MSKTLADWKESVEGHQDVKGPEHLTYKLSLFRLKKRRLSGDPMSVFT